MEFTKYNYKKVLSFIGMFFGLLLISRGLDSDIWFLLNHGRYVVENGFPHVEPFTIHDGFHFVMQQWLTGVIFWEVYDSFGPYGLMGLVYGVAVAVICLYYKLCFYVSGGNRQLSSCLALLVGILVCALFMRTRPQIFSGLLLLIEVFCLERYRMTENWRYLSGLPVVSVLMVNLHGAMWPMLLICMLPYFAGSIMESEGRRKSRVLALAVAAFVLFLAGFVNPYGFESMTYVFKSYGYESINGFVSEMHPINFKDSLGKFFWFFALSMAWGYSKKGFKWEHLFITLGTMCMAASTSRAAFQFFLLGIFPLAEALKEYSFFGNEGKDSPILRRTFIMLLLCLVTVFSAQRNDEGYEPPYKPAGVFLESVVNREEARIWTNYVAGGYLEFCGWKCYIDPRAEVFLYSNNGCEDVLQEYVDLEAGKLYYKDLLEKYNFDYIVAEEGDALYIPLSNDREYRVMYKFKIKQYNDKICSVFKKN